MIPLIYILALSVLMGGAVDIGSTAYATHESNKAANYIQNFYSGAQMENDAYWQRYIRLHHLENRPIRFPYRTGYNYNASQIYSAQATKANNTAKMAKSIANSMNGYDINVMYGATRRLRR